MALASDASTSAASAPGPSIQTQLSSLAARKETVQTHPGNRETLVSASKLAKNKRLPATMITPAGHVEQGKKGKKGRSESSKKKKRSEEGKEKALERMERLETKVRQSEEKKAKRQRAKIAWE